MSPAYHRTHTLTPGVNSGSQIDLNMHVKGPWEKIKVPCRRVRPHAECLLIWSIPTRHSCCEATAPSAN